MNIPLGDIFKLLLAILAGGLIGAEREYRDKAAGFRTLILICVGSALFTMLSLKLGGANDAARIAANIVSGVGFLCAGVIIQDAGRIRGLTTASAIWLTAALGMGIGGGYYWLIGAAVLFVMVILWLFPPLEQRFHALHEERVYELVYTGEADKFAQLETTIKECGLRMHSRKQARSGKELRWTLSLYGPTRAHEDFIRHLMGDTEISEFSF